MSRNMTTSSSISTNDKNFNFYANSAVKLENLIYSYE